MNCVPLGVELSGMFEIIACCSVFSILQTALGGVGHRCRHDTPIHDLGSHLLLSEPVHNHTSFRSPMGTGLYENFYCTYS
jgi:hypothetical protein